MPNVGNSYIGPLREGMCPPYPTRGYPVTRLKEVLTGHPLCTRILRGMTTLEYTNPIPEGSDPADLTIAEIKELMEQLRRDRTNKGITLPRFVRALNKAGYDIDLSKYKDCEKKPGVAADHVREYLFTYAYKVLNTTRVQDSVQSAATEYAMGKISEARITHGHTYAAFARRLRSARHVAITEHEYRAMEQGMTKTVPWDLIEACVYVLVLDPREVFQR
jgi:hypothetical protein